MERIVYRITLDSHKTGIQRTLQGFETADNMARTIAVNITASGDTYEIPLDNVVAMMYVTTPGASEPSVNECRIEDNTIIYDVLPIVEEGITEMQLKLIETSVDGAKKVLIAPRFAVEVTESGTEDDGAEQTTTFTALEAAIAKAQGVYDARLLRIDIGEDCVFRAIYADGTVYENHYFHEALYNGNALLSESWAKGGTGIREGEETNNSKYFSDVSRSSSIEASASADEVRNLVDFAKLHSTYTSFDTNFETGELEYISASHTFDIDETTGELSVEGDLFDPSEVLESVADDYMDEKTQEIAQLKSDLIEETTARQNAITTEKTERQTEIAVERARINEFLSLPYNGTVEQAILNDAKIDFKGITHTNVGEHIRAITSELDDSLKFLHDGVFSWENGDLDSSTGLELLNTSFDRTSYLPYHMLDNCLIKNTGTRELYAYCYTLNKTYIGFIKISDFPSRLIALDNTSYIRFLCRNDSTNLFKFEFPTVKSNDENIMDINSKLPNLPYVKTKKGKNLFNKADVTNGYLSGVTGGINNSDTYNTSDFIEVKSCEPITISPSFRKFLAYTVDKVPISNSFVDESTQNYVFTPEKDGYIRFSYYKSNDDITQVEYGTTPTSYEPYSDDLYFENAVKLSESMKNEVVGMIGNILSGKTLFCFGDSIMAGDGNSGVGIGDIIGSNNNMNIHDFSKGGATITWEDGVSEPRTNIISQVTEAIATGVTPDYIIFDGMTNDISGGLVKTLGTIAEHYSSEFDIYTFSGAFEHILKIMRNAFPSTKILYIRPHNMGSRNYDNQILYGNRALEICEKWSIPTCNLYKESGLNTFLESMAQFTKPSTSKPNGDETHPTQIGYELFYIPQITAKLKTL